MSALRRCGDHVTLTSLHLFHRLRQVGAVEPGGVGQLSPREVEVLRLVAAGKTNRETATALTLSEHTVARHLANASNRLGIPSRAALSAHAVRAGLA